MDSKILFLPEHQIITSNKNTWHFFKLYPIEMKIKWAKYCAHDVEYLAESNQLTSEFVLSCKSFENVGNNLWQLHVKADILSDAKKCGKITDVEFYSAFSSYSAYTAGSFDDVDLCPYAAAFATQAHGHEFSEKWNLYINELIKDLKYSTNV